MTVGLSRPLDSPRAAVSVEPYPGRWTNHILLTREDQVDEETAKRRVELLVDLQSRVMDGYNEERLGTVMEVLCEGFDREAGCYVGRTYADSVEVDGKVFFTAAGVIPAGTFVPVRITGVSDGDLTGEIEA